MPNFDDFLKRKLQEEAETDQQAIQQQPEPTQGMSGADMGMAGMGAIGLGAVLAYLGNKARRRLLKTAANSGFIGKRPIFNYMKSLLGLPTYFDAETHKFTPEEQKQLAARLDKALAQKPADLQGERLQDFTPKLFDLSRTPKKAVDALRIVMDALVTQNQPDQGAAEMVLNALTNGGASTIFKKWYKENVGKPREVEKSVNKQIVPPGDFRHSGATENPEVLKRHKAQFTQYDAGKMPMKGISLVNILKFYRELYGSSYGPSNFNSTPSIRRPGASFNQKAPSAQFPEPTTQAAEPSDQERIAQAHHLDRTARALRDMEKARMGRQEGTEVGFKDFLDI